MRKVGEEEDWKKKTRDRGGWNRLSDEAVKKLREKLLQNYHSQNNHCTIHMVIQFLCCGYTFWAVLG